MRLFNDYAGAKEAAYKADRKYIDRLCPYASASSNDVVVCGSWCPHFVLKPATNVIHFTCGTRRHWVDYVTQEENTGE